jgi:hypothetical protein
MLTANTNTPHHSTAHLPSIGRVFVVRLSCYHGCSSTQRLNHFSLPVKASEDGNRRRMPEQMKRPAEAMESKNGSHVNAQLFIVMFPVACVRPCTLTLVSEVGVLHGVAIEQCKLLEKQVEQLFSGSGLKPKEASATKREQPLCQRAVLRCRFSHLVVPGQVDKEASSGKSLTPLLVLGEALPACFQTSSSRMTMPEPTVLTITAGSSAG